MKKRVLAFLLALVMAISLMPGAVLATDTNVTEIATVEDLQAFAAAVNEGDNYAGKTVKLTADIDLAGIEWQPIGGDSVYFAGEFDGNGKTISNLTNTEDVARKGLFGLVEKCYIHDLTLKNVKFSGNTTDARIGALAGNLQYYNVIENVTIDGLDYDLNDTDGLIGGLAGYSWTSYVKNCTVKNADMNISSTNDSAVGVMIGYGRGVGDARTKFPYADKIAEADYQGESVWNYCDSKVESATVNLSGTVTFGGFLGADTYNSWRNYAHKNTVTGLAVTCAEGDGVYTVGGFMGGQYGGIDSAAMTDNTVTGTITSSGANTASSFGGFFGYKGGRPGGATGCTANVNINVAAGDVGGFVAETQQYLAHSYSFNSCTATGNVSTGSGTAGGFVANIQHGGDGSELNVTITNSYASGSATGTSAGSFVGGINDEKNGTKTGGIVYVDNNTATGTATGTATTVTGQYPTSDHDSLYVGKAPAAKIGDTSYDTLEAAFGAAKSGDVITLAVDCTIAKTIKVGYDKSLTLNLNGHKLSTAENFSGMDMFTVSGSLNVTGNGEMYAACDAMFNGNVTIEGAGKYTGKWTVIYAGDSAKATIDGGTFVSENASVVSVSGSADVTKAENVEIVAPNGYAWDESGKLVVAPIYPAKIGEQGYDTLAAAIAAVQDGETIALADGTHTWDAGCMIQNKAVTFTGGKNAVIDMTNVHTGQNTSGATLTFDGVTLKFSDTENYMGFAHTTKVVYTDCVINGKQHLYAPTVEFTNCVLNNSNDYSVWTYGAQDVTFTGCTFNSGGKAVLVYNEDTSGSFVADIKLTKCTFNDDDTLDTKKAAVELGNNPAKTNVYHLVFTDCIVNGFAVNDEGTSTNSTFWGNKNSMNSDNGSSVTIDRGENLMPGSATTVYVAQIGEVKYDTLQNAINAASKGDTIDILSDFDEDNVEVATDDELTIDLGENTVNVDIMNYGTLTVKNGTINNTNNGKSAIENNGAEAVLVVEDLDITSARHALRIDGGKATIKSGSYAAKNTNTVYAVNISGGAAVEIIDGIFKGAKATTTTTENTAALHIRDTSTVTIANGTFSGGSVLGTLQLKDTATITITGGNYDEDPTAYVAEGYKVTETTTGWFTVAAAPVAELIDNGRTLSLEYEVFINQYVGIEDYEQSYVEENGGLLVWTANPGENAGYNSGTAQILPGLTRSKNNYNGKPEYWAQTPGIAAKEYADELYFRIYLKLEDGSYIYTDLKEYSVQMYCENILKKDVSTNAKLVTLQPLCRNMLEYGASAQLHFNYNTSDLANANIKKEEE